MSDTKIDHSKKHPKYIAYHVRQGKNEGDKSFWTRIGAAWEQKDGNGLSLQLDGLIPLDGRVTLRIPDKE